MTLSITDDRITSDVTPHVAYRHPSPVPSEHGWTVSWLPNRVVERNLAISAMMIAELAAVHAIDGIATADDERRLRINDLAHELGMSGDEAIRLVLAPVVHDTHAIPAGDEPAPADTLVLPWQNPILIDKDGDRWRVVAYQADSDLTIPISVVRRDYGPLTVAGAEQAKRCPSCQHCGQTFHIEPAKTHDLAIRRRIGGDVVIVVGDEADGHQVYLSAGTAQDLGRALAALAPAQRQLLIDDLVGGEK